MVTHTKNEDGDMSDIDMETKPDKKDRKKRAPKKEMGAVVVGPAVIPAKMDNKMEKKKREKKAEIKDCPLPVPPLF